MDPGPFKPEGVFFSLTGDRAKRRVRFAGSFGVTAVASRHEGPVAQGFSTAGSDRIRNDEVDPRVGAWMEMQPSRAALRLDRRRG